MTAVLYYSPGACSMAAHVALEEAGAPYELKPVNLGEGEQTKPGYLAINPRGRVPALAINGEVLTENAGILVYLAAKYPKAKLLPDDPAARGRAAEWMSWLASTVHVWFAHLWRPGRYTDERMAAPAMQAKAKAELAKCFADIEKRLGRFPFAAGETFSVADAHLFVFAVWGRRLGLWSPQGMPALARWAEKMRQRPSVRKMLADEGIELKW